MPRDELDAFDRLYLDHGLRLDLGRLGHAPRGRRRRRRHDRQLDDEHRRAASPSATAWAAEHGLEGVTGRPWASDVEAIERELGVTPATAHPAQGRDHPARRARRSAGRPPRPDATRPAAATAGRARSAAGGAPSSPGCGSTSRARPSRAPGSCPTRRSTRVLLGGRSRDRRRGRGRGPDGPPPPAGPGAGRSSSPPGALRTPAVLQRSGLTHPAIGRHLRVHPVPVIAGRFDETIDMWRGTMQGARSLEFGDERAADGRAADRNGYVIESAPGHPGLLALALPWEGTDAHEDVMDGVAPPRAAHRGHARRRRGPDDA